MKKLFVGLLAIMMLVMSGCGDVGLILFFPIGTVVTPPTITSYRFTKHTAAKYIDGSVDFYAPDSDIDTITVAVFDSRGYVISRTKESLNFSGATRGTVFFSIDYISCPLDTYTFSIFLTDWNGLTSNQIVDTFTVP